VLGGLPARRATTLLFAIEGRTAQLMVRTRQAVRRLATERTAEQQDRAFLDALAQGRHLPLQPTIQDLERYAPEWAPLVPADPSLRAAVARLLGSKYRFERSDVPRLRQALGLDSEPVASAYERQHQAALQTMFAAGTTWRERLRWLQARVAHWLEALPPFWTVFALTLTEMVEAAVLALPTAVARVGPLAGLALLLGLGAINLVTIAALSEAFARNGSVRYGHVYFARLVAEYLGISRSPAITRALLGLISLLLLADCVGCLLAYCIGVSSTLAQASGISATIWAVVLLGVVLYFLRRETLDLTIASALVIGAVNLSLLVLVALLALPHVSATHLLGTGAFAPTGGGPFDPALLGLIFGVIMAAYFGHFSTGTCARLVLNRDPSGRSLLLGNVSAMGVAILLNCLWVIVVNGTLASSVLVRESGTAIHLLAAEVGPLVNVVGVLFVTLGMGMGSIHAALAVMYQVREWFPVGRTATAVPVVLIFGLGELLIVADVSFAAPIGVLGVLAYSVLGGMLPALLLLASRRKGEYVPAIASRLLGHPLVLAGVYVLFACSFVAHGLVIWSDPLERLAATGVGAALVVLTVLIIWRGAFAPRVVVELRVEPDVDRLDPLVVNITDAGRAGTATVYREEAGPPAVRLELAATLARQLKVWTHRLTPTGDSDGLAAHVEVRDGRDVRVFEQHGQLLVPLGDAPTQVSITL
jgi:hypothetical protein